MSSPQIANATTIIIKRNYCIKPFYHMQRICVDVNGRTAMQHDEHDVDDLKTLHLINEMICNTTMSLAKLMSIPVQYETIDEGARLKEQK